MYKKFSIIIILAILLGLLLYIKPFKEKETESFRVEYILPEADLVGRIRVLDLLKETTDLLIFNNVKSRQFLTYEFILSMAKMYGIDLQSPVYIFANDRGDYGLVIPLLNSNKLNNAIERVEIDFEVSDSLINNQKVYRLDDENIFFYKRKKYAVIYKGDYFSEIYRDLSRKSSKMRESWKMLFSNPYFKNEHLVMYTKSKMLNDLGVNHVYLAQDSDSTELYLKSRIVMNDSIPFLMNQNGKTINFSDYSKRMVDLHLNFQQLNSNTKKLVVSKFKNLSKKISFPMEEFVELWAGDLCFEEGGYYKITEKYVEIELDENFDTQEVEKVRERLIPRYKLMVSTVKSATAFINTLISKGIITMEDEQYRFLFSPLFDMTIYKNAFIFYTSENIPRILPSKENKLRWEYKNIELNFDIDTTINNTIFGGIRIPSNTIFESIDAL
ncbi:MAG: hypothetical protein DBW72_01435 [Flavobacteriales bacterium]|nr:MAG: hypothetical protein DBW72_01435 [Flavobacteriales bacterium]